MLELKMMQPAAIVYIAMFAVAALVFHILPRKAGIIWLTIASLVFIGICDFKFAAVALAAAVLTWGCGKAIGSKQDSPKTAGFILAAHIVLIAAVVIMLRYLADVTRPFANVMFPGEVVMPAGIIPVGIMIYSLKAVSYTAGIYRRELDPDTGLIRCILYMLFFPVLIFGPIEEPRDFLRSADEVHPFRFEDLQEGFLLLLWGFLLKLVLADNIAEFTDPIFEEGFATTGGAFSLAAVLLVTVQIYATFYGLSAIASGYSRILGFEVPDNFHSPLLASSMTKFRQSWNASLNSWSEKNILLPLTSGRNTLFAHPLYRAACLMLMVLFIGGWYGTAPHILIGALGLGLYEILEFAAVGRIESKGIVRILMTAVRFVVAAAAGLNFRCRCGQDFFTAVDKIHMTFDITDLQDGTLSSMGFLPRYWVLILGGVAILIIADIFKFKGISLHKWIASRFFLIRWIVYLTAFMIILIFGCWGFEYHETHILCDFLY